MPRIPEHLRGRLVVSCQPVFCRPLNRPDITARFALAAQDGGARGLRIEGAENLKAVRKVTDGPIIGPIRRDRDDAEMRITPTVEVAVALAREGADVVAFATETKVDLPFTSRDGFFDKLQVDLAAGGTAFDVNLIATCSIGKCARSWSRSC